MKETFEEKKPFNLGILDIPGPWCQLTYHDIPDLLMIHQNDLLS